MSVQPDWRGPRSLLELWHPTCSPRRRLGFGGAAPEPDPGLGGDRVDFALVAPLSAESSARWLEQAIERAAARLEADGILCVTVPRRWRRVAARHVRRAGLTLTGGPLTMPPWPDCVHAVSLDAAALRHAGTRQLGLHPAAAAALAHAGAAPAFVRRTAPGYALLGVRPPAPHPLRWLAALDETPGPCMATASVGARPDQRVAVVMRFTPANHAPDLVAKVALDTAARGRIEHERSALGLVGAEARRAGAAIPTVVTAASGVLATTVLPGRPASTMIAREAGRTPALMTAVFDWLRSWSDATASTTHAGPEVLHRLLLAPAARVATVAGDDKAMSEYVAALRALADRLEGRDLIFAAAHNDLTMSNVLVTGDGIGVVDWESASSAAPPLADLWYALADAVARAGRLTHAQAVVALVQGGAPLPAPLTAIPDERARELALTADEALLSFHACWLHHAGNELDRGQHGDAFHAVVRTVAAARLRWPGTGNGNRR